MRKLLNQIGLTLFVALISVPGLAPITTQSPLQQSLTPSGDYYNQLPEPQFRLEVLEENARRSNGEMGDGATSTFVCGGQNERDEFATLIDESVSERDSSERQVSYGTFTTVKLVDRCRTEGCGPIVPDGVFYKLDLPRYATNCSNYPKKKIWDDPSYESPVTGSNSPLNASHSGWQGINYIDDGYGYIYGRYLLTETSSSSTTARIDIPYSCEHQKWGFTSAPIARIDGYKANTDCYTSSTASAPSGREWPMEGERRTHYIELLEHCRDQLAYDIAHGVYGQVYENPFGVGRNLNVNEREMREIVVNIYAVLEQMIPKLRREESGATRSWFGSFFGSGEGSIEMACCPTPRGTLVEYQQEQNRICLEPNVCSDILSKKAKGSHACYNVSGTNWRDGHSFASYGEWVDGCLYERNWNSARGYQLFDGERGVMEAREWDYKRADGYSPVIVALITNQLVDAYFKQTLKRNRIENWPSPEALWQTELAFTTQAVCYANLARRDYLPMGDDFKMKKGRFVRGVVHPRGAVPGSIASNAVNEVTQGTRFSYPHEPRGYNGIHLGALHNNMIRLWKLLDDQKPVMARMYILQHALGPILDPPARMTFRGMDREFVLPSVAQRGPVIEPREERETTRQRVPPERIERSRDRK